MLDRRLEVALEASIPTARSKNGAALPAPSELCGRKREGAVRRGVKHEFKVKSAETGHLKI